MQNFVLENCTTTIERLFIMNPLYVVSSFSKLLKIYKQRDGDRQE